MRVKKTAQHEATVITSAAIKGGCAKTVTTAVTSWILSEMGYKVLCIDGDPQGNLTETFYLLPVRELRLKGMGGILQAIREKNPFRFITNLTENLDLLLGEEIFGTFPDYIHTEYTPNNPDKDRNMVMRDTIIEQLRSHYDFIIIDTGPTLTSTLTNFFSASDYVLGLFESSRYGYSSLFTLYETVYMVKEQINPSLDFLGLLIAKTEVRRSDNKEFINLVRSSPEFGPLCFSTVIRTKAATGRISRSGFFENPELAEGIEQYEPFAREVIKRVGKKKAARN